MKEIYEILSELHGLLTAVKASDDGGSEKLHDQIQGLFARVRPLIREVDNLEELVKIRERAFECASLAGGIFIDWDLKCRELRRQKREAKREFKTRLNDLRQQGVPPRFLKSPEKLEEFLSLLNAHIREVEGGEPA